MLRSGARCESRLRRRAGPYVRAARGLFFDVDFTLIEPGPAFQAKATSVLRRHGIDFSLPASPRGE